MHMSYGWGVNTKFFALKHSTLRNIYFNYISQNAFVTSEFMLQLIYPFQSVLVFLILHSELTVD